jgi:hypothetical protein
VNEPVEPGGGGDGGIARDVSTRRPTAPLVLIPILLSGWLWDTRAVAAPQQREVRPLVDLCGHRD